MVGWDELGALSLARQFPVDAGSGGLDGGHDPARLVAAVGPIQSQTARSPYLGLAARSASITRDRLDAAYERADLVRGSTIRGTVHTATPEQHGLLDVVTRVAQRRLFERSLKLQHLVVEDVWTAIEDFARDEWREAGDLLDELNRVLARAGEATVGHGSDAQFSRYLAYGAGGLVRRPGAGGWSGQGRPLYRAALSVHGRPRPTDVDQALRDAVRLHVHSHGPVSRQDIAWWSGLGLRTVDAAVADLDLTRVDGPDGRVYLDRPDPPAPIDLLGVRLLPEYDALFCGYDAKARDRFIAPAHHAVLWNAQNGGLSAPVLVDGRMTAWWRLAGSGRRRTAEVHWFARTRRPTRGELAEPFERVAALLDVEITALTTTRVTA